jgi:uncharacterized membrane protein
MILLVLFYIFFPLLILYLCNKYTLFERIGSVLIAYAFGLLLGNTGIFPSGSEIYLEMVDFSGFLNPDKANTLYEQGVISVYDLILNKIRRVQDLMTTITIPLALPLLLFGTDFKNFLKSAKGMILSMVFALIAVVFFIVLGYVVLKNIYDYPLWKVGGLLVGLYTGGTPNLASLKLMLNVSADQYIMTHTYDTLVSALYLFFLMSFGGRLIRKMLRKNGKTTASVREVTKSMTELQWADLPKKQTLLSMGKGLLLSGLIFGISGGLSFLFKQENQMLVVILSITTLSILASLSPSVRKIRYSFDLGMYLILIFCLVVASMSDISNLMHISPWLLFYISLVIFGTLVMHLLLSWIGGIHPDTLMITSTALICSPPFVPVIAGALKNREIVAGGLAIGILGYAIGNYLGFFLAMVLKMI